MTMKRSLVPLLVLLAACGKSDWEKFADAYCAEVATCCAQEGLPTDGFQCHEMISMANFFGFYTSQAGDACLAEMRSQVAAGTLCAGESPACDVVFGSGPGDKKVGEACDSNDDCAQSREGKVTCAYYSVSSASRTCIALRDVGEACTAYFLCVPSAFCDHQNDVCTARLSAGSACATNSECMDGHYCASDTYKCAAQKADGAACGSSSECQSGRCENGTCPDHTSPWVLVCGIK